MGVTNSSFRRHAYTKRALTLPSREDPFVMVTYDPQLETKTFVECQEHCVYTNNPKRCNSLPVPAYPTSTIDVPTVSKEQFLIDIGSQLTVEELVKRVTLHGKKYTDVMKVTILYQWLTNQNLSKTFLVVSDFLTVNFQLNKLKCQSNTYAAFFSLLCHYASIPCVIIEGHVKSSRYVAGELLTDQLLHEWNAVLVNKQWRLVDSFWGSMKDKGIHSPTTWYLFSDPKELIYTHYPTREQWQLLETPINKDTFVRQVVVKHVYFEQNAKGNRHISMVNTTEDNCFLEATNGEFQFIFLVDSDIQYMTCKLHRLLQHIPVWEEVVLTGRYLETVIDKKVPGRKASITVRFPETGDYEVGILTKRQVKAESVWDWVASFRVRVDEVPNWALEFIADINKYKIQAIRAFQQPVDSTVLVMRAVLLLLRIDAENWEEVRFYMYRMNSQTFYSRMLHLEIASMSADYVQKAKRIIDTIPPEQMIARSLDVAAFAKWAQVIVELFEQHQVNTKTALGRV